MDIIGHQKIVAFFERALANNTVARAYCLVGPDQVGKRALGRAVAAQLLEIQPTQLATQADFYYLERAVNEKTGQLRKDITIDQARQLKKFASHRSWLGGYKVAIINEAELLNKESSNALLKVLEETGQKMVFFLLTTNDNNLLPTIKSRCQLFYLSPLSQSAITQALVERGYSQAVAASSAELAWGRPGRALELAANEDLRTVYSQEVKRWSNLLEQNLSQQLKQLADLVPDKKKTGADKKQLQVTLADWSLIWRELLLAKLGVKSGTASSELATKNQLSVRQIGLLLDSLKITAERLQQNVNPKLLLETLLFKIN